MSGLCDHGPQDRSERQRHGLEPKVACRDREQQHDLVDAGGEALRRLVDPLRRLEADVLLAANAQQLGVPGDDRERRAQLVARRSDWPFARFERAVRVQRIPRECATATASARRRTPSFTKVRESIVLTVSSLMPSAAAASRLVAPEATRRSTARSRGVSAPTPTSRGGCRASYARRPAAIARSVRSTSAGCPV